MESKASSHTAVDKGRSVGGEFNGIEGVDPAFFIDGVKRPREVLWDAVIDEVAVFFLYELPSPCSSRIPQNPLCE